MTDSSPKDLHITQRLGEIEQDYEFPLRETPFRTLGTIAPRCATVQDLIDAALKLPVGHTLIGDATVTPEDAKALLDTHTGTVTRHA